LSGSVLFTVINELSSYGVTAQGSPTGVFKFHTQYINDLPVLIRVGYYWTLAWDMFVSKHKGNAFLSAQEEARKQEQTLAQDVLVAYWNAYNAQQLILETKKLRTFINTSKK